jgi:hypothetical protein
MRECEAQGVCRLRAERERVVSKKHKGRKGQRGAEVGDTIYRCVRQPSPFKYFSTDSALPPSFTSLLPPPLLLTIYPFFAFPQGGAVAVCQDDSRGSGASRWALRVRERHPPVPRPVPPVRLLLCPAHPPRGQAQLQARQGQAGQAAAAHGHAGGAGTRVRRGLGSRYDHSCLDNYMQSWVLDSL